MMLIKRLVRGKVLLFEQMRELVAVQEQSRTLGKTCASECFQDINHFKDCDPF